VATTTDAPTGTRSGFDRYFRITERGSTVRREVRGGLVTFMTMAYIVVLNPLIIGLTKDADGRVLGIPQVAGVTALVAAVTTIAMGVFGRMPIANGFLREDQFSDEYFFELKIVDPINICHCLVDGIFTFVASSMPSLSMGNAIQNHQSSFSNGHL